MMVIEIIQTINFESYPLVQTLTTFIVGGFLCIYVKKMCCLMTLFWFFYTPPTTPLLLLKIQIENCVLLTSSPVK